MYIHTHIYLSPEERWLSSAHMEPELPGRTQTKSHR